jgi:hypothetical protein
MPRLRESEAIVRKRLVIRAGKLLAILLFLNLALYMTGITLSLERLWAGVGSFRDFVNNFILNMNGKLVAFEILYSIAIVLIISSLFLGRGSLVPFTIVVFALALICPEAGLFRFLSVGLAGMLAGMWASMGHLEGIWRFLEKTRGIPVIVLWLVYQNYFHTIRSLTMASQGLMILAYVVETSLWLCSFVFIFRGFGMKRVRRIIVLLGHYTLVGYVIQMGCIRLGHMLLRPENNMYGFENYILNVWVASVVVYLVALFLDYLRKRVVFVDQSYRLVLG